MSGRFAGKRGFTTSRLAYSRADWLALVEVAQKLGKAALAGPIDPLDLAALRRRISDAGEAALPVQPESKHAARSAFVAAARGFDITGGRETWARLLLDAAEIVATLIDDARREGAAGWQRQFGD